MIIFVVYMYFFLAQLDELIVLKAVCLCVCVLTRVA